MAKYHNKIYELIKFLIIFIFSFNLLYLGFHLVKVATLVDLYQLTKLNHFLTNIVSLIIFQYMPIGFHTIISIPLIIFQSIGIWGWILCIVYCLLLIREDSRKELMWYLMFWLLGFVVIIIFASIWYSLFLVNFKMIVLGVRVLGVVLCIYYLILFIYWFKKKRSVLC